MPNKPENLRLMANQTIAFMTAHYTSFDARRAHSTLSIVTFSKDLFNESVFGFLFLSFYRMIRTGSTKTKIRWGTKSESAPIKMRKLVFANSREKHTRVYSLLLFLAWVIFLLHDVAFSLSLSHSLSFFLSCSFSRVLSRWGIFLFLVHSGWLKTKPINVNLETHKWHHTHRWHFTIDIKKQYTTSSIS